MLREKGKIMTDNEITIAVAKLDGFEVDFRGDERLNPWIRKDKTIGALNSLEYLTSRDAIIPVIEKNIKQPNTFCDFLLKEISGIIVAIHGDCEAFHMLIATPKQLCVALLKATGKWVG